MSSTITPVQGTLDAVIDLPGSKSITNRALVIAALADGPSQLTGLGISDDTEAMMACLRALGAEIEVSGSQAVVGGTGGQLQPGRAPLDAQQSGTTARFVAPLLLVAGGGELTGHPQLRRRPMEELLAAMRQLGAVVHGDALPLTVEVPETLGHRAAIAATVSSQFISGLLLCAPALPDGLELELLGDPVSMPYIDMTMAVMETFGAEIERDARSIRVGSGGYSSADLRIEPDASTATYPLAAAAIVGGRVRITGLGSSSVQGDIGFVEVLDEMGADVFVDPESVEVRGSGTLKAVTVDLGPMSDTAPTFAVLAARASGTSHATGIGFIRESKESDRVAASVTELNRLGVEASVEPDGFSVTGGPHHQAAVETYDDHRMAMALALLGLVDEPVTITEPGCVAKTFPGYFEMLDRLRSTARTAPLVLAIDGPAGSGKSTVSALAAERLRLPHLDTGAMYRAIALAALRRGLDLTDEPAVVDVAESARIHVSTGMVLLDDHDVTTEIRSPEVTAAVSPVAAIGGVRRILVARQREWATARGAAVLEGRDIGTAVFPDAAVKVYLTASVEERARRRAAETGDVDIVDMAQRIADRDRIDSGRTHDPLTIADDAHVIDSSDLTVAEVVEAVTRLWPAEDPS